MNKQHIVRHRSLQTATSKRRVAPKVGALGDAFLPTTSQSPYFLCCNRWATLFCPPYLSVCGGQTIKLFAHPTQLQSSEWFKSAILADMPFASIQPNAKHQSGAVLIISLIMLLLLTLIGITGSQVTGLEEKMAGNMRDQSIAFQTAEMALRAGEAATATALVYDCAGTGGYYDSTTLTGCQLPNWQTVNWTDPNTTVTFSGGGISYSYYIEQLDSIVSASNTLEAGASLDNSTSTPWYRITARGTGNSGNAAVWLQSTYMY